MLIKLKDLQIETIIGIYDWEQSTPRKLLINVEIECVDNQSIITDNIKDTIDYDIVYTNIKKIINSKKHNLIESLAGDIVNMICKIEGVIATTVEINKIKIYPDAFSTAVTLYKKNIL